MALGSIIRVNNAGYKVANKRHRVFDVYLTSGANYTSGGETVTCTQFGMRTRIDKVDVLSVPRGTAGALPGLGVDYGTDGSFPSSVKLVAYLAAGTGSPSTEAAANTDLSTYKVRLAVTGA